MYLVCELGHVVLQAALVVGLLTHLNQDVEVTVLLSQRCHPLVLTQIHCNTEQLHSVQSNTNLLNMFSNPGSARLE